MKLLSSFVGVFLYREIQCIHPSYIGMEEDVKNLRADFTKVSADVRKSTEEAKAKWQKHNK